MTLDLRVWGRENIAPGPKLLVANHITSYDPFWLLSVLHEPVHVIIGPGYKSPWVAKMLDAFEHINALDGNYKTLIDSAVKYLQRGEAVAIAPEGDLHAVFQLGQFQPGVAAIYRRARVPIVPIALLAPKSGTREYPKQAQVIDGHVFRMVKTVRGPYCMNIGEPFLPDLSDGLTKKEQNDYILGAVKQKIEFLLEDARVNKFWLAADGP